MPATSIAKVYTEEAEAGAAVAPNVGITRRFGGGKTTESQVVEAEGSKTLVTPASGKAVTLYWVGLTAAEANSAEVKVEVKLGTKTPYTVFLGKAGGFAHWEPETGAVEATLSVKLSAAQKVAVAYTYTEG